MLKKDNYKRDLSFNGPDEALPSAPDLSTVELYQLYLAQKRIASETLVMPEDDGQYHDPMAFNQFEQVVGSMSLERRKRYQDVLSAAGSDDHPISRRILRSLTDFSESLDEEVL